MTARVLVVAGSDSGGGAGVQADVRTITMLGAHPMTAVTAVTAQNTLGVEGVHSIPPRFVVRQMACVAEDIGVDAVKIGMLGGAETAAAVADELQSGLYPGAVVFDPVMVASSGAVLADARTVDAMDRLARLSAVVTPNLPELAALCGRGALDGDEAEAAAVDYAARVGAAVLVKGGHAGGDTVVDRLVTGDGVAHRWTAPRIDTPHAHGTGCTLASGIAAGLAQGMGLAQAIGRARLFVRVALREAPGLGGGHGPMGHGAVRLDGDLGGATPNQVTVPAADPAASARFYELLGLRRIVDAPPRYARFEAAGGMTLSVEDAAEMDGGPVLFLECADLDGAVARLRGAGVAVTDPAERPWGWTEARLRDPAGNGLCLYRAGEARRFPPWRLP